MVIEMSSIGSYGSTTSPLPLDFGGTFSIRKLLYCATPFPGMAVLRTVTPLPHALRANAAVAKAASTAHRVSSCRMSSVVDTMREPPAEFFRERVRRPRPHHVVKCTLQAL